MAEERINILEEDVIKPNMIVASDDFVQKLMTKRSFIEGLKSIDLQTNAELEEKVSKLEYEILELNVKISELEAK